MHTSRLAVHLTPRRAILRRATRTAKCFDTVSAKPKDRLCCTVGLSKTAWRIGCSEEQRSRSFASHPEHRKRNRTSCLAQEGAFMRIEKVTLDTAILELL